MYAWLRQILRLLTPTGRSSLEARPTRSLTWRVGSGANVRASPSPSGGGHPHLDEDPPDISAKAASEPRVASAGILGGAGTLFANARRYCASYYYAEEWKAFS